MKTIQLTQGQVAIVDDDLFEYLNQWKWYAQKDRHTFYAVRRSGKGRVKMHRLVLGLEDKSLLVDHEDFDGLNNQRYNIRIATKSQNCAHRKSRGNTSKYLGVCQVKWGNKWQVHIVKGGVQKYLGLYENEGDAARAYNKAAIEIHGEFANLNKIAV